MSSVIIKGDTSGQIEIASPAVAGSNTQTLVAATGTLAPLIQATAQTASGTSVDFTGIPSWVKRITVMLNGVSTSGTSGFLVQIGSSSFTTSGYVSSSAVVVSATAATVTSTAGFILLAPAANTDAVSSVCTLCNVTGNVWGWSGTMYRSGGSAGTGYSSAVPLTLSGTLDRVRITTVNGTDTFDAGTINILYE